MVGQNIGKYRVLDRVGRGGMGTVYRAIDETLHREVAIKVLNAELNDPEVAKRFRAEAITVARLSHPGIATIYELFQYEGQWLMVMEFVRGETLEHMVDRMGPLSPQRSAELCMQALAALAHAHSMGVVHRDLKPANMMITETGAVKIMDFGIARVAGTEHLTNAGFMMGTPAYMSPEQVRGEEIDARADLYAMGVVFYRLTTAKLPFKGDTPFAMAQSQVNDPPTPVGFVRADLPPWVEPVVVRALAKKPEERFQSAAEFHEAFARCLAGLPLTTVYGSTSPTEMMTTPRGLPTGSLSMRGPGTGPLPVGPISGPLTSGPQTAAGAIPAVGRLTPSEAMAGAPTVMAGSTAPAVTGSAQTAPVPGATAPVATAPAAAPAKAATPAQKKNSDWLILTAVAATLVVLGGGAYLWIRSRPVAPPPAQTTEPAPTAEVVPVPPPETPTLPATDPNAAAAPPAGTAPGAGTPPPPAGTSTAAGTTPGATPASPTGAPTGSKSLPTGTATVGVVDPNAAGNAGAKGRGTPAGTAAPAPPAVTPTTPATPANDPLVAFNNVKLYVVTGKRGDDRDVLLNFAGGQMSILPKNGGEALIITQYRNVAKATYVKGRDPRWDAGLSAPPEGLDVGSMFRQSRHWLVVQTKDNYTILRLDDENATRVLDTFESRTGLRIDRPKVNEK